MLLGAYLVCVAPFATLLLGVASSRELVIAGVLVGVTGIRVAMPPPHVRPLGSRRRPRVPAGWKLPARSGAAGRLVGILKSVAGLAAPPSTLKLAEFSNSPVLPSLGARPIGKEAPSPRIEVSDDRMSELLGVIGDEPSARAAAF